jgi:hypothetical protein
MSAALYDITVEKRTCFGWGITLTNRDGSPYNLSGASLTGEIRRDFDDSLQAVFNTQILNAASGTAVLFLTTGQTCALEEAASSYDIFLDQEDECSKKLLYGAVAIIQNKTK